MSGESEKTLRDTFEEAKVGVRYFFWESYECNFSVWRHACYL